MKLLFFLLLLVGLGACSSRVPSIITGFEGQPLPSFDLLLMDSITRLNTESIPVGKPIVLFLFSPDCPYCRAQTEEMTKNIKALSNIQVYLLSNFPFSTIKGYYHKYNLKTYPNITVVQDYDAYFANYYKVPGVPFIAIYNKEKKLKLVLLGEVDAGTIKELSLE